MKDLTGQITVLGTVFLGNRLAFSPALSREGQGSLWPSERALVAPWLKKELATKGWVWQAQGLGRLRPNVSVFPPSK